MAVMSRTVKHIDNSKTEKRMVEKEYRKGSSMSVFKRHDAIDYEVLIINYDGEHENRQRYTIPHQYAEEICEAILNDIRNDPRRIQFREFAKECKRNMEKGDED